MRKNNASQIQHPGVIESVSESSVLVRIRSHSACGTCRAKSQCGMTESADKVVEVEDERASRYTPGQEVTVFLDTSLGFKALFLGYLIPFLIMLVALFAVILSTGNEALGALAAIALLPPYYFLLYRRRHLLRKTFRFRLH